MAASVALSCPIQFHPFQVNLEQISYITYVTQYTLASAPTHIIKKPQKKTNL